MDPIEMLQRQCDMISADDRADLRDTRRASAPQKNDDNHTVPTSQESISAEFSEVMKIGQWVQCSMGVSRLPSQSILSVEQLSTNGRTGQMCPKPAYLPPKENGFMSTFPPKICEITAQNQFNDVLPYTNGIEPDSGSDTPLFQLGHSSSRPISEATNSPPAAVSSNEPYLSTELSDSSSTPNHNAHSSLSEGKKALVGRNTGFGVVIAAEKPISHACHIAGCDKVYKKASHLKAHLRWHSSDRPFTCNWLLCGKRFLRSEELQRHLIQHTGDKRFSCRHCDKRFKVSHQLQQHLQTHLRIGSAQNSRI